MAITSIKRDLLGDPNIVRIICDDDFDTIIGSTYLTDQADNIAALNHGAFEWVDNEFAAISYSGVNGMFRVDVDSDGVASLSADEYVGKLVAYADNATSFRLRGPSSPNDPSAGADVQTYSGMFYNDSYSNVGNLKTRATFGANTEMDLVFQAPRALLLLAYDGTQTDGVIKAVSQTDIQFAPRSSGVPALTNYANFDALTTGSVDNASALALNTHVNHLHFQHGKTDQAIVLPIVADGDVANLTAGIVIFDPDTSKLMFYTGSAWETVTSA